MILALKVRKLLNNRCMEFLASIVNSSKEIELTPNNVPLVRDYVPIFPKDLVGLPSNWDIIFSIELVLGTAPVSQAPYRLTPIELKELKV